MAEIRKEIEDFKNKEFKDNSENFMEIETSSIMSTKNDTESNQTFLSDNLNSSHLDPLSKLDTKDNIESVNSPSFVETTFDSSVCTKKLIPMYEPRKEISIETDTNNLLDTSENKADELSEFPAEELIHKIETTEILRTEEVKEGDTESCSSKGLEKPITKKIVLLPEGYIDSSHSSSSGLQSVPLPCESSCSSQDNNCKLDRFDFENAIPPIMKWSEVNKSMSSEVIVPSKPEDSEAYSSNFTPSENEPVIKPNENTEHSKEPQISLALSVSTQLEEINKTDTNELEVSLNNIQTEEKTLLNETQPEVKEGEGNVLQPPTEPAEQSAEQPQVMSQPVLPPAPRKRGRPRKQVLPNPSPLVESWGPNAQQFMVNQAKETKPKTPRSERRQTKRRKFNDDDDDEDGTPKRRYYGKGALKKKKKKPAYVPKKRGPKKKHSELENFQNFEEETRMSASEGHGGFHSRSGFLGEDSQGSFEGHGKSSINKKGRMEVVIDGCKPVTVQQIVEYHWPPPASLPFGEKSEGLMIQEQITEYLGVKSFKRKYPSIKRRPVEMEERNYLQENGYVSENMCDMGLTAVYSADIIEIMYNDFPHKFEEYRKYMREKKAKEQRALREKQAAERADMDPLKEAVESAQMWNSELNKTRRMNAPKYNNKVLLGNWFDYNCEEDQKLAMYLKKKDRRMLLINGVRTFFENFLKPVVLTMPTQGLTYGGRFQLLAPGLPTAPEYAAEKSRNGVCLSVTITPRDTESVQCIINDLPLVGSPVKFPCSRNTFCVESDEGKLPGQPICFGDTIYLRLAEQTEIPLYVGIDTYTLGAPVGKCGFPTAKLSLHKSGDCRFKVLHVCPHLRQATDGSPCAPFEKVVISHANDSVALCAEIDFWSMSLFSYECEISANTKKSISGQVDDSNIWIFLVGTI